MSEIKRSDALQSLAGKTDTIQRPHGILGKLRSKAMTVLFALNTVACTQNLSNTPDAGVNSDAMADVDSSVADAATPDAMVTPDATPEGCDGGVEGSLGADLGDAEYM